MINRTTSFTNVWGPIGTGNDIDTFHVFRVDRIFNRSKGAMDGVKRSKGQGNIMLLKNPDNPISGSLDVGEVYSQDPVFKIFMDRRLLPGLEERFLNQVSTVTNFNEDIQEMSLLLCQVFLIRDS